MFRILGSVNALNERINVNLSHHDVNWIYNLHKLTGQRYYLKARVLEARLILCLPESNKGIDKDYLIISREWHDGLHCPTQEGTLGGVLKFRFIVLALTPSLLMFSHLFPLFLFVNRLFTLSTPFLNNTFGFSVNLQINVLLFQT